MTIKCSTFLDVVSVVHFVLWSRLFPNCSLGAVPHLTAASVLCLLVAGGALCCAQTVGISRSECLMSVCAGWCSTLRCRGWISVGELLWLECSSAASQVSPLLRANGSLPLSSQGPFRVLLTIPRGENSSCLFPLTFTRWTDWHYYRSGCWSCNFFHNKLVLYSF